LITFADGLFTCSVDNDAWADGNCARSHLGGWWYNSCDESNLNGRYFPDGKVDAAKNYQGIYWEGFTGSLKSLKSVKMMVRPADA
jgi:Fibrinogen beta and gamma chains, C-terminal globular domain